MRKLIVQILLAVSIVLIMAGPVFAYAKNKVYTAPSINVGLTNDKTSPSTSCASCHPTDVMKHTNGPHGGYTTTTNKCALCHTVHAAGNSSLLPGATVTAACNFCHDLTGTNDAPYNMSGGMVVGAAHRVAGINFNNSWTFKDMGTKTTSTHGNTTGLNVTTSVVPGASGADGTTSNIGKAGGKLSSDFFTCNSCHTPHAMPGTTVNKYFGESQVKVSTNGLPSGAFIMFQTDRLLKKTINGVTVSEYGSAWCMTCHKGRDNHNMGGVYNHPVNETAKAYNYIANYTGGYLNGSDASDYTYHDATYNIDYIIVDPNNANSMATSTLNKDPRTNSVFSMVYGDPLNNNAARGDGYVSFATGSGPSCQQCHASPRQVESKWALASNPTKFNFPHVTSSKALLVETDDDFCTNCHGLSNLP